ncbi:thioesterase [Rhodobacteraceae bacterium (ex Bugula neritina AB1)]|nr:thioesterase [Rhodobacteraceae bacterium (ex Bugula neritina AB1)]
MSKQEPLQQIKERRDGVLAALAARTPYLQFMGIRFERRGDELTAIMAFDEKLIGNPVLRALHGGATASFLEAAAIMQLSWDRAWDQMENGHLTAEEIATPKGFALPKTIDLTVDYLRSGLARDSYARVKLNRAGRRYASVHIEAWQDNRDRLFAQASGHFLMPPQDG